VTRYLGDLREARTLCEESVRLAREVGNAWIIAVSLKTLGEVLQDQGEQEHAAVLLRESLTIYRDTDNQTEIIECLEAIARLEQASGRLEPAATLWNATDALRTIARLPLPPIDRIRRETLMRELQDQLGASLPTAASDAGMTLHQTVDFCLEEEPGSHAAARLFSGHG